MDRSDDPKRRTLDRIHALDLLLEDMDGEEEADVGTCPKCGGRLMAKKKADRTGAIAAVVRCAACGYFYVVRW